jgi:hypothetical protein
MEEYRLTDIDRKAREIDSLERRLEQARADLSRSLARAHADGYSLAFLGKLAGMSSQRVSQIVNRVNEKPRAKAPDDLRFP